MPREAGGSAQPFGTSSSHAGGPRRPKPEDPHSRWGRLPPELGTEEGRSRRSTQPFGTSPLQAGDREDPVSGHWLPGPRKWSPGRAGAKAEGTYPVSCHPGGWSAAWVRGGYRGSGARGGLNGECRKPSPRAPRWTPDVRNAVGRRSRPYGPLIRAFYWAVALGQNSWGRVSKEARGGLRSKGSLRGKGSLRSL